MTKISTIEDKYLTGVVNHLEKRHYVPYIVNYTSYGSTKKVRFLGRLLLVRKDANRKDLKRGFYSFLQAEVPKAKVKIKIGDKEITTITNRGGYIDTIIDIELKPGIHKFYMSVVGDKRNKSFRAYVIINDINSKIGVISDIDDTILKTNITFGLLALFRTIFISARNRRAETGMKRALNYIYKEEKVKPIFYLSTGAWNFSKMLSRFLSANNFPLGPILLRDWGPTEKTIWVHGKEFKTKAIKSIFEMFPNTKWILLGDDTQYDAQIYYKFAKKYTDKVKYIIIKHHKRALEWVDYKTQKFELENTKTKVIIAKDGYEIINSIKEEND